MNVEGGLRHVAFWIEITMPHPPAWDAVDKLETSNLDDAVAVHRIEARGFGVDDDLAQEVPAFS
jgi:hypothetical protein